MYIVSYGPDKNRLYITIKDILEGTEADEYRKQILELLNKVSTGFTICIDMREADLCMFEHSSEFDDVRKYAVEKQLICTIHVVNENTYTMHHKKPFAGIQNICTSIEFAEEFLDNRSKKGDLKCIK